MAEELERKNDDKETQDDHSDSKIEENTPSDERPKEKTSKPVVIKADAYKTLILYASRYANQAIKPEEWKEIYGVLIGTTTDEFVFVEAAEALTFGHATDVQLDERHYGFIERIENKLYKESKGHYIIGWFHSHPGLGLFFSYIDLINQLGFQGKNNDAVGLVFDHTLLGKKKEEKIRSEDGTEYTMSKYNTGFEIYRLTNVNMDINSPEYDTNYHKVDYIVDGLNKFFFANVLSELSALVTEGKPLQSAYGEESNPNLNKPENFEANSQQSEVIPSLFPDLDKYPKSEFLAEIPMNNEIAFGVDDFSYGEEKAKKKKRELGIKEQAEQLIYEGNQAFNNKDAFSGIEKFRKGINKYKEIKDFDRVLDLLRIISQHCISNNHLIIAKEFASNLYKLAKKQNQLFYIGVANYIMGYLLLKKGDNDVLEDGLNKIQDAAINFEKEGDFAGAGMCFNKIGTIYHTRLNKIENTCLFYRAAIENYNKAILKIHPLNNPTCRGTLY
ncbi:hypothetical protein LCGC14_1459960 [marine sediment metagenome]|uniref:MPN domain-containing protein n=1 Tax=marine sediment metagenome TaxID=412755 RepID=A0A0F9LVY2_9ZZZZ